jgi:uncharacterized protein YxjI
LRVRCDSAIVAVMRFQMRKMIWSLRDTYAIRDADDNEVFRVTAKIWSIGAKLAFEDLAGRQLAFIQQRVMAFKPTYDIYRDDVLAATVTRKVFSLRPHYDIEVPDGEQLAVDGDFTDHEYAITRAGSPIAVISMRWFALSDTYGVDVSDVEDPILALAITVVLEMVDHHHRDDD